MNTDTQERAALDDFAAAPGRAGHRDEGGAGGFRRLIRSRFRNSSSTASRMNAERLSFSSRTASIRAGTPRGSRVKTTFKSSLGRPMPVLADDIGKSGVGDSCLRVKASLPMG
jgi:hypothetical protein